MKSSQGERKSWFALLGRSCDCHRVQERVPNFGDRDELEAVSHQELLRRIRRKEVTLLDLRSAEEFEAGHLPGAVNIPIDELRRRLKEIPPSPQVVAYCRGPSCIFSYAAVAQLRKQGYEARRLADG